MHGFDEQRVAFGDLAELIDRPDIERPVPEDELGPPTTVDGFVLDVLAAVADMALRSKRRQADLDASLRHAGLDVGGTKRLAALERLRAHGFIDKVVELSDGGVLLSVTALGLDRLNAGRRR